MDTDEDGDRVFEESVLLRGTIIVDWNQNGKIDAEDHAFTAFIIDEISDRFWARGD